MSSILDMMKQFDVRGLLEKEMRDPAKRLEVLRSVLPEELASSVDKSYREYETRDKKKLEENAKPTHQQIVTQLMEFGLAEDQAEIAAYSHEGMTPFQISVVFKKKYPKLALSHSVIHWMLTNEIVPRVKQIEEEIKVTSATEKQTTPQQ